MEEQRGAGAAPVPYFPWQLCYGCKGALQSARPNADPEAQYCIACRLFYDKGCVVAHLPCRQAFPGSYVELKSQLKERVA